MLPPLGLFRSVSDRFVAARNDRTGRLGISATPLTGARRRTSTMARIDAMDRATRATMAVECPRSAGISGRSLGAFVMVGLACLVVASGARSQSVVAWGSDAWGSVTVLGGLSYIRVAGGDQHTVALRSDGAVVAWGLGTSGQCNVPVLPTGRTYVG